MTPGTFPAPGVQQETLSKQSIVFGCDFERLHDSDVVFSDLFWKIWNAKGHALPSDTTLCYMFEMITPSHVIGMK